MDSEQKKELFTYIDVDNSYKSVFVEHLNGIVRDILKEEEKGTNELLEMKERYEQELERTKVEF